MGKKIKMYRSISNHEYSKLLLGIPIDGNYDPFHIKECGSNGYYGRIVCAFEDEIKWQDDKHSIFITIEVDEDRVLGKGESIWMMPKNFSKTKTYRGKSGIEKWTLNEYYLKQYSILDVTNVSYLTTVDVDNYLTMRTLVAALSYLDFKSSYLDLINYSKQEVFEKLEELIKVFPETNTFIKKSDYENKMLDLFSKSFGIKKRKNILFKEKVC